MSSGCAYMTSQVPLKPPGSTAFPGDPVVKRPEETQEQVLWAGWERERVLNRALKRGLDRVRKSAQPSAQASANFAKAKNNVNNKIGQYAKLPLF